MRVAIVGNSHIAARQAAIKGGAIPARSDVVFWGLSRGRFTGTVLRDGRLVSRLPEFALMVSGGLYDDLPINAFDVLVFEGIDLQLADWARSLNALPPFSTGFRKAAIKALMRADQVYPLAVETARAGRRVLVSLSPDRAASPGEASAPVEIAPWEDLVADICRADGVEFIRQPPGTRTADGFTEARFRPGALALEDLDMVLPDTEFRHMNGAYGALLSEALDDYLRRH